MSLEMAPDLAVRFRPKLGEFRGYIEGDNSIIAIRTEELRQLEHMLEEAEIIADQYVYTILYEGDSPDMAERYVVGNMEEQVDGADVISASSPLGAALQGASAGDSVTYEAPNGSLTVTVLDVTTA